MTTPKETCSAQTDPPSSSQRKEQRPSLTPLQLPPPVHDHEETVIPVEPWQALCQTIPSPGHYLMLKISREVKRFFAWLPSLPLAFQEVQQFFQTYDDRMRVLLAFGIIHYIVTRYGREGQIHPEDEAVILSVLAVVPDAATIADGSGLLLLHYFCVMEEPSSTIVKRLVDCYPAGSACFAAYGFEVTPLHILLLKETPGIELALYMIEAFQSCCRCEGPDRKLPIHFLADMTWSPEEEGFSLKVEFLRKLLELYPCGLIEEITEEVHALTSMTYEEGNDDTATAALPPSSPAGSPSNYLVREEDVFQNLSVMIGQECFKMKRRILKWSPLEKLQSYQIPQLNTVMDQCLARLTQQRLQRQQSSHRRSSKFL